MIYPYCAQNRLDAPHSYMYAPYRGEDFLDAYVCDRRESLARHLRAAVPSPQGPLKDALVSLARGCASTTLPSRFSPSERTQLQPLLAGLLGVLAAGDVAAAQPWLILVIQRFEVTKKLYCNYAPGFRKGEGDTYDPARYVEFALCLALAHSFSGQLQYLSTLLKLMDLLLSLDVDTLRRACHPDQLMLLVVFELDAVGRLAASHGVTINAL